MAASLSATVAAIACLGWGIGEPIFYSWWASGSTMKLGTCASVFAFCALVFHKVGREGRPADPLLSFATMALPVCWALLGHSAGLPHAPGGYSALALAAPPAGFLVFRHWRPASLIAIYIPMVIGLDILSDAALGERLLTGMALPSGVCAVLQAVSAALVIQLKVAREDKF